MARFPKYPGGKDKLLRRSEIRAREGVLRARQKTLQRQLARKGQGGARRR